MLHICTFAYQACGILSDFPAQDCLSSLRGASQIAHAQRRRTKKPNKIARKKKEKKKLIRTESNKNARLSDPSIYKKENATRQEYAISRRRIIPTKQVQ